MSAAEAFPLRVAMLGGTFDPIHLGHLRSAVELREALGLDKVLMMPAHVPPLREAPGVSAADRLAMLQAGIGDTPGLVADGRELEREGPSYSADTLAQLRDELGDDARLVMMVGHDAFLKLAKWRDPDRLFTLAHIVVIDRPGHEEALPAELEALISGREADDVEVLFSQPAGGLLRLGLPSRMAISATELRQRLHDGRSIRYLVPEKVETFIQTRNLYR